MAKNSTGVKILSIDIGGSHIKATVLDASGNQIKDYIKVVTPSPASPENILKEIVKFGKTFSEFDRISVGFPGFIRGGVVKTAPNLGTNLWKDFNLEEKIGLLLQKQTKVINDADLQGLGFSSGKGLEMVITLGTGFGTALLMNGVLLPHFELAHLPIRKNESFDTYVGEKALIKEGKQKWNKRVQKVIEIFKNVINYDTLYISGGNARNISFKITDDIKIVDNTEGIKGGAKLWM